MKKSYLSVAVLAMVVLMSSCGGSSSSFESDVRKRAEYMCKVQKLSVTAATDEKAAKELEAVKKEMDEFDAKMEKKHKDKKGDDALSAKAQEIVKEVMEKCK